MQHDHTRWGWGPVRGAYAPQGGHVKAFGVTYSWVTGTDWDKAGKWTPHYKLDFWRILHIDRTPASAWGTRWAVASLDLRAALIRAESRIH